MRKILALLTFALFSTPALAQVEMYPMGKFNAIRIYSDAAEPVTVKLKTELKTTDGCNHFGLSGEFRVVALPEGTKTSVQDFVANFGIYQTEMACPPLDEARVVELESKPFTIEPKYNRVNATVLVPDNFELVLE
jgi:hypothetical protein